MSAPSSFALLRLHLASLAGPDRDVDVAILRAVGVVTDRAKLTENLSHARALIALVLPGFWVTSGICGHSGHASIGPDYNGPDAERLRREWPEADFHSGFDADLKPGGEPHRECAALLTCLLAAVEARLA